MYRGGGGVLNSLQQSKRKDPSAKRNDHVDAPRFGLDVETLASLRSSLKVYDLDFIRVRIRRL